MAVRFFQPAQSTRYVPSYAPLPLDAIAQGAQTARQTYSAGQQALDTYSALHRDILGQLAPANRAAASELLSADSAFIDRLTAPDSEVPYQDMVPLLRRRTRATRSRLAPYIEDSAKIQAFKTRVSEGYADDKISLSMRNYYNRLLGDYQGLQLDEDGIGTGFQAPSIVQQVDLEGQIDEFMQHIAEGDERVLVSQYGMHPGFVEQIRQTYRSPEGRARVREILRDRLLATPENRQYLMAEYKAFQDLMERSGETAPGFTEFASSFIDPYVQAASMGRQEADLVRNPAYSASEARIRATRTGVPIKIGSTEMDFSTPTELKNKINTVQQTLQTLPNQLIQGLPADIREQAYVTDAGKIALRTPVIGGINRQGRIMELNAQIEQQHKLLAGYKEFDQQLRHEAGLDELSPAQQAEFDKAFERALSGWAGATRYRTTEDGRQHRDLTREELRERWVYTDSYDRFLENFSEKSPEYARYLELYKKRTGQGIMSVSVPSQLTASESDQYVQDLKRLHNFRKIFNATTRAPYERKEAAALIATAEEIVPIGPLTDTREGATYIAYNVTPKDETEPVVILMEPGMGSLAALQASGMTDSSGAFLYGQMLRLGPEPGAAQSFEIPMDEDTAVKVRLLPLERQQPGRKYLIIAPVAGKDAPIERFASDEAEVIAMLRNYISEGLRASDS